MKVTMRIFYKRNYWKIINKWKVEMENIMRNLEKLNKSKRKEK